MKAYEIYNNAYRLLNYIVPIRADCGKLCNKVCCKSDDEDMGMYLFPYEQVMFEDKPQWLRIEKTNFKYKTNENALIALCRPPCERGLRPLSCRIFPLFPYLNIMGELEIIFDPRGKGICPLNLELISKDFIKRVYLVFKFLLRFEPVHTFTFELSRQLDEIKAYQE